MTHTRTFTHTHAHPHLCATAEHVPEPILQEITNYVKHRGTAIHLYATVADTRAEVRAFMTLT